MSSKNFYDYPYPTGLAPLPEFDVIELSELSREEILVRSRGSCRYSWTSETRAPEKESTTSDLRHLVGNDFPLSV